MSASGIVSRQDGYALLDALVGIAITSIVLLFAVGAMRELISVRKRLENDAAHRLELTAVIKAIQAQLDQSGPTGVRTAVIHPLPSPAEFAFQGSYPTEGAASSAALVRLRSEIGRNGKQGLSLEINRSDIESRSATLIEEASDLRFSTIAAVSPFVVRELVISFARNKQPEPISLHFTEPRFARPLCIAAPFDPACRP